uniref:Uncharacterized protein n=1 Tax=Romanomermis culicivorax TaxID=13658 RepID=A0A915HU04_ROMCU
MELNNDRPVQFLSSMPLGQSKKPSHLYHLLMHGLESSQRNSWPESATMFVPLRLFLRPTVVATTPPMITGDVSFDI